MMISDLPSDLLLEILSRVALKSMRTVRLTCKKWNDLLGTQSFRKMQIGKASAAAKEGETQMMAVMGYNLYLKSIFFNGDPSSVHKGKLICLNEQVKISQVYHCEGLLLCILKDYSRFVVWNPYFGETRWIEPRYCHSLDGLDRFCYALGYEDTKSRRSFKFLRFIDYFYNLPVPGAQFLWYEMYDFDSGLWTTLDVTPHWRISVGKPGVSLKGNTYWPATERNLGTSVVSIICFDFTRERFGQLLPLPFSAAYQNYVTLSCVREEKLAVLLQHDKSNPYELAIWITTKIEPQEVSWCMFLRVAKTGFGIMVPSISSGFFVDEEKKIAMVFGDAHHPTKLNIIGDAGYFRQLDVLLGEPGDQHSRPHLFSYVPSLLQIKQPSGGERKQQSQLEKRRYNEYMLRLVAYETYHEQLMARYGKIRPSNMGLRRQTE